ncbi:uncharacterized protein LOC109397684 isoform X1 [Aedes albopictus]|uniref:DUF243 domain-containing protein n=1 Tax=Aedes albopictus TaxID=7160 RepID=A0ABM1Y1D3_AEDAL
MIVRFLGIVTVFTSLTPSLLEARPEPPIRGGGGGPGGPYPPSRPEPPNGGYSYGPPPLPPSISVNSYGSATSEYGPPSQAPIIHKHVYVHVPPPEDEVPTTRKPITVPPPQKHYKIVFIKAPSPPSQAPPVIPPLPQNEEKTLVYVLVKKQEEQPDIVIPTPAPTPPSKPEVYFIRYKTQVTSHRSRQPPNLSKLLILFLLFLTYLLLIVPPNTNRTETGWERRRSISGERRAQRRHRRPYPVYQRRVRSAAESNSQQQLWCTAIGRSCPSISITSFSNCSV